MHMQRQRPHGKQASFRCMPSTTYVRISPSQDSHHVATHHACDQHSLEGTNFRGRSTISWLVELARGCVTLWHRLGDVLWGHGRQKRHLVP